ncbi:GNAT family N-acetyltransferase [Companilactobacillus mishanensis]|uniref:N-acetyltransferase family protein n=1 Tax=Companilactobacillus mishanensis TaxID=2486008 RepID=A0ABW9P5U0_9LACO|nr:GNAT family N-acetyltransferase [Companilactobacillus mishanensis]MQS44591.1 N-acetyltransferase family protein [Companilactobacillus mishanensis]MQS89700.1 N-acetyltransferase family protein [Companilactobacillus mishanensis]
MVRIRPVNIADAKAALAIYAPYVTNTSVTFEYEVPTEAEFENRISEISKVYPYLIAEDDDGTILGYAYAHRYRPREAYDWAVEISIYVDKNTRGAGIGKMLYTTMEEELAKQNVVNIVSYVTGENKNSVAFHEKMGYQEVGILKKMGYKFDKWYDVYVMQKRISDTDHPGKFIPISEIK